jgi:acetyltransferase ESCO-like protein
MIREWAREFYEEPPRAHGCQVCGLHYLRTLPEDRAQHRRHHQQVIRIFSPSPSATLKKEFDEQGKFVPVRASSKRFLRHRLYEIALMFRREGGYDFVQWDETSDDGHGYLLIDAEGRALGGAVVRWREYKDLPPGWFLGVGVDRAAVSASRVTEDTLGNVSSSIPWHPPRTPLLV